MGIFALRKRTNGIRQFSTYMNHVPAKGMTFEMYDTPHGAIEGEIIKVHEAISFSKCSLNKTETSFGLSSDVEVLPSNIEFQIWLEYKEIP
ncbi:MAG: hypothetical protein HC917_23950 [Richelia sp. SM2_1_7]|nr:hypothetical protein [Richelia sp. SM2_1_7]